MKCILLVRVSTESQSFDEQEKELYELARSFGYTNEEIVSVAEKESGIKLKEEERKGLNRMKKLLSTGEFNCVFAWEISRIGRKKKVLFSILDYLVSQKIQLIIKEPSIRLLKENDTIDEGAETVFTLYAQLAESEMRNKSARFARAKKEYFNKGKYMGGKIMLGYKVNQDGYWEVDEKAAKIVHLIFDLYNSGEYSMTELAKELMSRGYFRNSSSVTSLKAQLSHILKNPIYKGIRTSNNLYPQLIDEITWNKTVKRRESNRHMGAKKAQRLLSALIRCKCGASYSANLLDCTYSCRVQHNSVEKGLEHSPGINLNMAESLAWYVALTEMQEDMIYERDATRNEYEKEIQILEQKIEASHNRLETTIRRRSELDEEYYVKQHFTKERYEELTRKVNEVIDSENANIRIFQAKITSYKKQIEAEMTFNDILNKVSGSFDELKKGTDVELMRKIIRRYIKEVRIEPLQNPPSVFYNKKIIFEVYNNKNKEQRSEQMTRLGIEDLQFINKHEYYVDTKRRKAFFDEHMTNEVPMYYMEREKRRRKEYRKKNKIHGSK